MNTYRANYEQIAADHLAHWQETGENPWQSREHVEAVVGVTLAIVMRYSKPGDAILDAGCGLSELMPRIKGRRVKGCDISERYLAIDRARGLDVDWADLEALPYGEEFDMVVATDVLEHVLDLNAVVRELLRVLKPGGYLVIRSPEAEDLRPYLAEGYPYEYVHLRRFDEATFKLLLTRIFPCTWIDTAVTRGERNLVVRK